MSSLRTRQLPPVWFVSCLRILHFLFSVFFVALFCARTARALDSSLDISQYAHTSWKARDGFAPGGIDPIAQTPDGYLWLGTDFGLYRFDGIRAVSWHPPAGKQLPGNYIRNLLVTRDGTLWIATTKGLASWKNGKLTDYPESAGQVIHSLLEDHAGTVWFGTVAPGRLCAAQGEQVLCYGAGSFGQWVNALYEDRRGNLWVAAATGVWRWDSARPERYALPGVVVNSVIEGDSGELLLLTDKGLKQIVDGRIQKYALPGITGDFTPFCFFRDSDGALWIAAHEGLLHIHTGRSDKFGAADGLSGALVNRIFEDRERNVWVSTSEGLDRFREYAIPTVSRNQGLSSSNVWAVQATPDGTVWISTPMGLNRWRNGHVTVYGMQTAPERFAKAVIRHADGGLTSTSGSLGVDGHGRLFVSTREGVFYFDGTRFIRVAGAPGGNIWSIDADGHGKIWVNDGFAGLFYFGPGKSVQPIPWSQLGQKGGFGPVALLPDRSNGGAWLGFLEGGITYFKDGKIHVSYSAADGLGSGRVSDLRFDPRGTLWAATEGGLSRIRNGRVQTLTSKNDLPCEVVHWSIEDEDHFVWLLQPCGLVRIARSELDAWVSNPSQKLQLTIFDTSDGVTRIGNYGGYGPHMTKAPDGKIWFAAPDGVQIIDPRHRPHNKLPPPVHIEQIIADGKTYDASQALKLPPLMRDLTIDYTALSLVVPEKMRFRVKLEGQDKDWRELADRRVHYTNLAPKHYRFLVKACNNSGVWNEEGEALDFAILPAYYQTNWFRAVCVAAVLALLWGIYRVRVGVLEQRQQLLEQNQQLLEQQQREITSLNDRLMKAQEEERWRIAGELHDGVLQKLTLLSLMLGAAKRQVPPDSEAKGEIADVQKKLIDVGTDIRQLSHELHPALLQEAGLPTALSVHCDEFSRARGIPVSCEADASVRELCPGTALCIFRIAQEALGNIAKHSNANKVQVRLTRDDARVRLSISDDGVGFASSRHTESGGLGLINMRERVRQLHGTLELESEPGRGTTVRAEVPFRSAS